MSNSSSLCYWFFRIVLYTSNYNEYHRQLYAPSFFSIIRQSLDICKSFRFFFLFLLCGQMWNNKNYFLLQVIFNLSCSYSSLLNWGIHFYLKGPTKFCALHFLWQSLVFTYTICQSSQSWFFCTFLRGSPFPPTPVVLLSRFVAIYLFHWLFNLISHFLSHIINFNFDINNKLIYSFFSKCSNCSLIGLFYSISYSLSYLFLNGSGIFLFQIPFLYLDWTF